MPVSQSKSLYVIYDREEQRGTYALYFLLAAKTLKEGGLAEARRLHLFLSI